MARNDIRQHCDRLSEGDRRGVLVALDFDADEHH
ncbi:hypothetical protein QE408_002716 [Agrobacterium larrymoorei]|uniref:Uncharacterized protein n=1 Tax=Agrobacterium larrymoorei TaxID=160699 RepID=A0ABU0UL84_9HYPH|nr:hypothetical protein [Agrobacterium larrymoorei]